MTFREFWPLYLQAHSQPATRAVHHGATVIGVGSTLVAAITLQPAFLLGIGIAYGLAIGAHTFIEKNQSMIGVNPIWGAIADLRMFWFAATGGLDREIARCDTRIRTDPEFRRQDRGAALVTRAVARRGR
jgi:hypothetical protein